MTAVGTILLQQNALDDVKVVCANYMLNVFSDVNMYIHKCMSVECSYMYVDVYIYMLCAKFGFGLSEDFTAQNVDLCFAQQFKDCANNCRIYRVLLRALMRGPTPCIDLPLLHML